MPEGYESAIEYALGASLQNVLVENERDAAALITYLKQKSYGRVTFRPLTACRPRTLAREYLPALNEQGCFGIASELVECDAKFLPFVQTLLGTTVVVDGMNTAERLYRKYNQGFKIVTLDGEIYARGGEITGGSRRTQNSGLLSQEKQIEQARNNLERIRSNIARLNAQREERTVEIAEAEEKLAGISARISEVSIETSLNEDKARQCADVVVALKEEIAADAQELEKVVAVIKALDGDLVHIDELEQDVKKQQEEYGVLLEASKSQSTEQKSERETLSTEVMNLRVRLAEQQNALDGFDTDLFRLRREEESLQEEKLDLIAQVKSAQSELERIRTAPSKTKFSEEDAKRIGELEKEISGLSDMKKKLSDRIVELDGDRTRIGEEKTSLAEKKIRDENMLERVDDENRYLQEQQVTQRDDIKAAYDDIMKIIAELTEEMRSKFMTAFESIKANFSEVFVQLFNGGKGDLRLDTRETDDPLEAGIDIFAQPPGKKLQNLTLLSGGEQALTAIAILFAILKLKPMPFCVLDEIEAALDDANANLFAEFLKKFSTETQFIVITHRKPTMRHADTIFGVTMEEKGVTKIVSISFEEAQKHASENR